MDKQREKLVELLKTDTCQSPLMCDPECPYSDCDNCFPERFADHLIANGVTVQEPKGVEIDSVNKWVPVSSERLPEDFVSVQVFVPSLEPLPVVHEGYYVSKESKWGVYGVGICNHHAVTHWKPLSEPPKEVRDGSLG